MVNAGCRGKPEGLYSPFIWRISVLSHAVPIVSPADGHHKLIRWRLVTHGAIDRYSRSIVYLQCSGNSKSSTVYKLFLEAVNQYALP